MTARRWTVLPACPEVLVREASGFPPLLTQLLYNRGVRECSEFEPFLAGDDRLAHDPFQLPDMAPAVSRIYRALLRGEKIAVFGDFDADGVTATVLLVEGLQSLGADVIAYLPHRATEGHGLSVAALEEFKSAEISLIITVDCGITSSIEVEMARRLGMDVVVTDHHAVSGDMPKACAVVNPKRRDSAYPYPHLAGVGVAFKLLEGLVKGAGHSGVIDESYCLVALGTIADMSPLTGENRYLVKRGIEALCSAGRPGVAALMKCSGLPPEKVSSGSVAWDLAPRLNAAGRIEHARVGYRLLHTRSPQEAGEMAGLLESINKERQALLDVHWKRARELVLAEQVGLPILIVGDSAFPQGVCGLVASRLVDEFRRPAIVMQTGDGLVKGSCRSVPEFDIIDALGRCSDLFSQYGGHPAAAGFSMPVGSMDELRRRLTAEAEARLAGVDLNPVLTIDAEASPASLTGETFRWVQRLAPFGQGNRSPVFLARGLEVLDARTVGSGCQHLKMRLRSEGIVWTAIGFGIGERCADIPRRIDVAYNSQVNRWNGQESLELNVADLRASE